MFCQLAVGKMGYPGAEAVRFLGVTTSSVNRLLAIEEMPDLRKYLKMLWNQRYILIEVQGRLQRVG